MINKIIVFGLFLLLFLGGCSSNKDSNCFEECKERCETMNLEFWDVTEDGLYRNCTNASCECIDSDKQIIEVWREN